MGKYSRDKGVRGERDIMHKLGSSAKRVGHSYIATPVDVKTDFAVYQIRNCNQSGNKIVGEIERLKAAAPNHNHYVVFKPTRGKWLCVELLEQHTADHGEKVVINRADREGNN